jgi:hypothetical protein
VSWDCKHSFYGSGFDKKCMWCGDDAPEEFCECEEPVAFKNDKGIDCCSKCFKLIDMRKTYRLYMDKSYIGDNVCVSSMLEPDIKSALDYAFRSERIRIVEVIEESEKIIRFKGSVIAGCNKKEFSYTLLTE